MDAHVGHRVQPVGELGVQVVEVAEAPAEVEVLADVAERPLDLALGLRAVRPAGARHRAVVARQVDKRRVEHRPAVGAGAGHGGLHAVVEHLVRGPAEGLEGAEVAAQHRAQVLAPAEPAPEPAAVAEHHREQPHRPRLPGIVGELRPEVREVRLRLAPRRRLEAQLEPPLPPRPDGAQVVGHRRVASGVAELGDLAVQAPPGQPGMRLDARAQVVGVAVDQPRTRLPRPIGRHAGTLRQAPAHSLSVKTGPAGDLRDGQPLSLQVVNHEYLRACDHR